MKKLTNKILLYLGYGMSVAILLTLFAHMLALGIYIAALVGAICCVLYFHFRKPNDN